ncbi:MAG: ribonuclease P protein component [Ignavibacteriaceae bacterium]
MKKFSLSGKERIKSKKEFDLIYSTGKTIYSADKKIKALFIKDRTNENPGVKIAVAISKRSGNAVWRNRVRRIIKEIFRLNKESLLTECREKSVSLNVIFSAYSINEKNNKKVKYCIVSPPVLDIINKLKNEI